MSRIVALIDGDNIVYRSCWAQQKDNYLIRTENKEHYYSTPTQVKKLLRRIGADLDVIKRSETEPLSHLYYTIKRTVERIVNETNADDYEVFLGGTKNFRLDLYQDYKAGRPAKPVNYHKARDYLVKRYGAVLSDNEEADDMLGIRSIALQKAGGITPVICSLDKDLHMIPGMHYNWISGKTKNISPFVAITNFYKQLLTGDPVDNIKGLKGIGPIRAGNILMGCQTELELYHRVLQAYCDHPNYQDKTTSEVKDILTYVAQLVWIRREENEYWQAPAGKEEA